MKSTSKDHPKRSSIWYCSACKMKSVIWQRPKQARCHTCGTWLSFIKSVDQLVRLRPRNWPYPGPAR
jgi:hypothetical protein